MTPQPHKNWFLHIVAGIVVITAGIFYLATRPTQDAAPAVQALHHSFDWGDDEQRPTPKPTPMALPTVAIQRAFVQPAPPPTCQPCEERWNRYRTAIETGLGKDDYRDYHVREIPQAVPNNPMAWRR
jgi:hypothetical protein